MQYSSLIPSLIDISKQAGEIILKHFKKDNIIEIKSDESPVTIADKQANEYIEAELKKIAPQIRLVSEEGINVLSEDIKTFWLVDPLDGTKSFIRGDNDFTVNIGLIVDGKPSLGVIYIPVQDVYYFTGTDGFAYKKIGEGEAEKISVSNNSKGPYKVVASHSHLDSQTRAFINSLEVSESVSVASSIKFCIVAEGKADVYPRFGPTMWWDTAAGHAILLAAGGTLKTPEGEAFGYDFNKSPDFKNGNFIGRGF
jgi:3'(2'), 5'-bisphosphate nucleotidase